MRFEPGHGVANRSRFAGADRLVRGVSDFPTKALHFGASVMVGGVLKD